MEHTEAGLLSVGSALVRKLCKTQQPLLTGSTSLALFLKKMGFLGDGRIQTISLRLLLIRTPTSSRALSSPAPAVTEPPRLIFGR